MSGEAAAAPTEPAWHRLSRRMLLIHPLRAVRDLLPALLPMIVVGNSRNGDSWSGEIVNLLAVVVVLASSAVRWWTTRYRITGEQAQLRHGLLKRETVTVRLDRVRTVDLTSTLVHRILGLTALRIGTGVHEAKDGLVLDGMLAADAERLRVSLLHRVQEAPEVPGGDEQPAGGPDVVPPQPAHPETVLARFSPRWVAYAPLSTTGLVTALVALGAVLQLAAAVGMSGTLTDALGSRVETLGLAAALAVVLVVLVVASVLGGVAQYVLVHWGTTVTRHGAGTLQVTRGLLTTRSTTLEEAKVRGVVLTEPALLRSVRAAHLSGIVTGASEHAKDLGGASSLLLPPSPRGTDIALAGDVLGTTVPLRAPLVGHGPRAGRRRWSRALQGAGVVVAATGAAWWWWDPPAAALLPALAALLLVPVLAVDRTRSLGHALTPDHLVTREGSVERRTAVIGLDGIIGWEVEQTIFQRRLGLVTLTALTAAGSGGYRLLDVPADDAYALVRATSDRVCGAA